MPKVIAVGAVTLGRSELQNANLVVVNQLKDGKDILSLFIQV